MTVRRFFSRRQLLVAAALALGALAVPAPSTAIATTAAKDRPAPAQPNFGPNVLVFNPGMPQSQIQAKVDAVATQQVANQFGTQRFALLFEPGTYGSAAAPLIFQVGYYTTVAGLGASPSDVTINGAIDVFNQCDASHSCTALVNFWRSLSNLTINVTLPKLCGGTAPVSPMNTWFQTALVQPSSCVFLVMNCCWDPLSTVLFENTESAMKPPLEKLNLGLSQ